MNNKNKINRVLSQLYCEKLTVKPKQHFNKLLLVITILATIFVSTFIISRTIKGDSISVNYSTNVIIH